jgi:hypothetical protein
MDKPPRNKLSIAYTVLAVLVAIMMAISASGKLTLNPGAVKVIHDDIGLSLGWFPVLAACEIAGGLGLLAGIFRSKIGMAAGIGLVVYFVGAMVAHVVVGDWAGLKAPIAPFILSVAVLTLRITSTRSAAKAAA